MQASKLLIEIIDPATITITNGLSTAFFDLLNKFGINVTQLIQDINDFHDKADYLVSREQDCNPKKTHALERVFNRALTQVLFSGRNHMQVIDIFLSIASETNSQSSYYFVKYGLERTQVVEYYNQHYVESKVRRVPANARADEILAEYCDNLNVAAKEGKIDPVVGREFELDEMAQILAKRNKCNILMVGDAGVGKTAIGIQYFCPKWIAATSVTACFNKDFVPTGRTTAHRCCKTIARYKNHMGIAIINHIIDSTISRGI